MATDVSPKALIVGLGGPCLSDGERAFLDAVDPWGVILFARNVDTSDQLSALTAEIRRALSRDNAPILIDQEGGRVQRLGPPHWRAYPPAGAIGQLYARDQKAGLEAATLCAGLIADDLRAVGINVACLPVLDVPVPGADPIIGDRGYSNDPDAVRDLGRAIAKGILAGGCLPVVKHVPGHGRAQCDSHHLLPRVDVPFDVLCGSDFAPFRALQDMPLAMTAHVVYSTIDAERPATISRTIISQVIRREIGFDGLLMTDDLSMGALAGTIDARARASIDAGCDVVLHCNGDPEEMAALAEVVPALAGRSLERANGALARLVRPGPDRPSPGRLDVLMAEASGQ